MRVLKQLNVLLNYVIVILLSYNPYHDNDSMGKGREGKKSFSDFCFKFIVR